MLYDCLNNARKSDSWIPFLALHLLCNCSWKVRLLLKIRASLFFFFSGCPFGMPCSILRTSHPVSFPDRHNLPLSMISLCMLWRPSTPRTFPMNRIRKMKNAAYKSAVWKGSADSMIFMKSLFSARRNKRTLYCDLTCLRSHLTSV